MKNYKWQKIDKNISYTPDELRKIIGASKKTIYSMMKNGLKPIPGGKNPYRIKGSIAKNFFRKRQKKQKRSLTHPNDFNCFKCKAIVRSSQEKITIHSNMKIGECPTCKEKVFRYISEKKRGLSSIKNSSYNSKLENKK